ncbi:hypothetical protein BRADI_3g19600v3 [Brachypodium distachyon]|uniref:Transmembrane 9 superfamily member n=1 Tax=Brachypodium distachyon TaxID=15368 RepID=I1I2I4_BRADI|nr:hypothetical protein BRADI_3g19600v3 [Brachypodium distachyon]
MAPEKRAFFDQLRLRHAEPSITRSSRRTRSQRNFLRCVPTTSHAFRCGLLQGGDKEEGGLSIPSSDDGKHVAGPPSICSYSARARCLVHVPYYNIGVHCYGCPNDMKHPNKADAYTGGHEKAKETRIRRMFADQRSCKRSRYATVSTTCGVGGHTLTTGSSALYLFLYATFYFFTKLEITKFVSDVLYFGYMLISSYAFFALTGTIGFYACFMFTRLIYSSVKIE